jgi:hypothetical protein
MVVAVLIVGSGLALYVARAQQSGSKRTDLQRHDLSAPGREVVQVRVDFDPGYAGSGNGADLATYVVADIREQSYLAAGNRSVGNWGGPTRTRSCGWNFLKAKQPTR